MDISAVKERLERTPVIAAVRQGGLTAALSSPAEVIFALDENIRTATQTVELAHNADKLIFIHADLTRGIGKDKCGIEYLASIGADGVISTHANLLRYAKEYGLVTVQRYFAVDSQGLLSIREMINSARPDLVEIMPGVVDKVIRHFASDRTPIIAAGLIETKAEVQAALSAGALAVSTGRSELWYL
ncbi:MAG: glycerol-3-phosphate responsive antiterminator [Clostridia bacterium]|nr:glycerol-3-phosphate responsive antiterminator [Clostridia bacterium]